MGNDELENKFGCTIPFLPPFSSNVTRKPIDICKDEETNNSEVTNPHPYMGYGLRNKAFAMLYFPTDVKVKRTVYDYDFLALVGELGGYVGLLVGVSLAELIFHTTTFTVKQLGKKYLSEQKEDARAIDN